MPSFRQLANFPLVGPGAAAATAALVDISPLPAFTFPAGSLVAGTAFKVTAFGRYTCGTTATNLTLGVYWGGTGGLALATTGAQALTVSQTNAGWFLEYWGVIRLGGTGAASTASIMGFGKAQIGSSPTALGAAVPMPNAANAAVTVDATIAKVLSIGATLSQITGAPTAVCDHLMVEQLNAA